MNTSKLEKQQNKLMESGVMDPTDRLVDFREASYKDRLIGRALGKWKKGWVYFTEQKLIVTTGFIGHFVIPYKNIRELSKCSQFFIPIGITITHEDEESGKVRTDIISLTKRDHWIDFMAQKAGISIS